MEKAIYEKIILKKEFSDLPKEDVEKIYSLYEKRDISTEDKIKLTRDSLRKVYLAFTSSKVLNKNILKKKSSDEILKKHISTRERFDFYEEIYSKLIKENCVLFDLGAGINGLSYPYLTKNFNVKYFGVEAVGQMVELMEEYFKKEKFSEAFAIKGSLFDLDSILKIIKAEKGKKVVFLFKVLDSLEMVEKNYSKKLLEEIVPLVDKLIVSFATRSLVSRKPFKVKRFWFENFLSKMDWKILDSFEIGSEKYIVFSK